MKRVTEGLKSLTRPSASDMARVHNQRVSIPAQAYLAVLPHVEPGNALSAIARDRLLAWDGSMDANRVGPTIYSAMRDALLKEIFETNLPADLADAAWHPADRGLGSFGNRLKARMVEMLRSDDRSLLADGDTWPAAISRALARRRRHPLRPPRRRPRRLGLGARPPRRPSPHPVRRLSRAERCARSSLHTPQRRRRHATPGRLFVRRFRHRYQPVRGPLLLRHC